MVGCMPSLGPQKDDSIKTQPTKKRIFYMVHAPHCNIYCIQVIYVTIIQRLFRFTCKYSRMHNTYIYVRTYVIKYAHAYHIHTYIHTTCNINLCGKISSLSIPCGMLSKVGRVCLTLSISIRARILSTSTVWDCSKS